ncbi:unnamed protein product [Urochloa humidicola]
MGMTTLSSLWLSLLCSSMAFTTCAAAGLRLSLTHVDANLTVAERMRRAMARTRSRLASTGDAAVSAPVHWATSQYIAEYLIGDPPQRAEAIIDTGSNLVWTQCSECSSSSTGCFGQNLPYYDPSQSTSDLAVACGDAACSLGSETQCASDDDGDTTCAVSTSYGAGDIAGVLATETFTFGSSEKKVVITALDFGCITATELTQGSLDGASGIIGLGRGGLSLVSQLGDTKFSYCLTPYNTDTVDQSHLFVGDSAGLSPGNNNAPVTSVPFVKNPNDDVFGTFYYLPLTGIAVGEATLDVPASAFALRRVSSGEGWAGTLIDSGSPLPSLVDVAYRALRDELARQLGASLVQPPEGYDVCVARGDAGKVVPPLVLHFGGGGGDLVVPPENYWGAVDDATACMMVLNSSPSETTTIGNYMQQNMHLLYDLGNNVLSFQTVDCSSM